MRVLMLREFARLAASEPLPESGALLVRSDGQATDYEQVDLSDPMVSHGGLFVLAAEGDMPLAALRASHWVIAVHRFEGRQVVLREHDGDWQLRYDGPVRGTWAGQLAEMVGSPDLARVALADTFGDANVSVSPDKPPVVLPPSEEYQGVDIEFPDTYAGIANELASHLAMTWGSPHGAHQVAATVTLADGRTVELLLDRDERGELTARTALRDHNGEHLLSEHRLDRSPAGG